jgi:hypothetical protein
MTELTPALLTRFQESLDREEIRHLLSLYPRRILARIATFDYDAICDGQP